MGRKIISVKDTRILMSEKVCLIYTGGGFGPYNQVRVAGEEGYRYTRELPHAYAILVGKDAYSLCPFTPENEERVERFVVIQNLSGLEKWVIDPSLAERKSFKIELRIWYG